MTILSLSVVASLGSSKWAIWTVHVEGFWWFLKQILTIEKGKVVFLSLLPGWMVMRGLKECAWMTRNA
jgi:hypothetical protein